MYYSAIKPAPNPEIDNNLPHITIQMPVYKESLEQTMYVFCISTAYILVINRNLRSVDPCPFFQ